MDRDRILGFGLRLLILACVLAVVGWNASRFVGTKPVPRMKDLSFLPPPIVAEALAMGQGTAAAKLRWIDSFAYFEYQIERKDDHVAGADGRGGFVRLYETLIALDPRFLPFYEQAVLNTSGILSDHRSALEFCLYGSLIMPHESELWRIAAAELAVHFNWTKGNPFALDAFLHAWADNEPDEDGRARVWDWRRGLAFRSLAGLETLPWWLEQLHAARPDTALHRYIEGTLRELYAAHAVKSLPGLMRPSAAMTDAATLDPVLVHQRFPRAIPDWEALAVGPEGPRLRPDPFGWPFVVGATGKVTSPGLEQRHFLDRTALWRGAIADQAAKHGRPPRDAAEAGTWGGSPPAEPPGGGRWSFRDEAPVVIWPDPPFPPWPIR